MNKIKLRPSFFFIISMLFCLPIALANIYFRDDLSRADYYFVNLKTIGRPIADILHDILTAFNSGADLSPLTLIISSIFLATSSFVLFKKFSYEKSFLWASPFLFIICNPFILQGLSYKYDSISISASVLFAIMPFAFNAESKLKRSMLAISFFYLAIGSYQASVNVIIATTCFVVITEILNQKQCKNILLYISSKIVELSASLFLYFLTISFLFPHTKSRSSIASIDGIARAINKFYNDLISLFHGWQIFYIIFIFAVCLSTLLLNHKKYGIIKISFIISLLAVQVMSIGGISIILAEGLVGYRTYLSFGIFMMSMSYIAIFHYKQSRILSAVACYLLLIYFISLSFAYGNILSSQRKYEQMIVDAVYENLSNSNVKNKKVYVSGKISTSHMTKTLYKLNDILINMNPIEPWTGRFMLHNLGLNVNWTWSSVDETAIKISNDSNSSIIKDNDDFIIYNNKEVFSVLFK
ncbi:glucosyltransferase domain-containing protein [Citrobacter gillenii]|uniref:glucosyltransferase domain-containing protein n=1 Tax=Citrobacter gillenii TaxID=67828 RepID=UPI0039879F8C